MKCSFHVNINYIFNWYCDNIPIVIQQFILIYNIDQFTHTVYISKGIGII
jgi:hypothetical protein